MFNREVYILNKSPIQKDLYNLFKANQKLIILDIGSCEGEDSIRYSKMFPNSRILAFEPLPSNQELILENLRKYEINNVELVPYALSDKKGTCNFHVSSGNPDGLLNNEDWNFGNKSSSLLQPDKHLDITPWVKFHQQITVKTNTLLNISEELKINDIDFVHIDVQGAELMVLNGAGVILKNIKVIWLEVANLTLYKNQAVKTEIEDFMKKNGFYLIKTCMEGDTGDQMYLNNRYFKTIALFSLKKHFRK